MVKDARIQLLNPHLANQIAAGEVVERPASVIKELVENSIDALSTKIEVEIEEGGIDLIRIRDNGRGIHPDDLSLAFSRHATSKILSMEDLAAVMSLGFRGEALASIAAVSRTRMASAIANAHSGFEIECASSEITLEKTPVAHPQGTTVEVKNLFYNTPARRKFLRAPRTEFQQVETVLLRLALSRFDIAFSLKHQNKMIFNLPVANTVVLKEQRIAALLGEEFLQEARVIEFSAAGFTLSGWIGAPTFNRHQADHQYFYINQRFVRDKLLSHAVRQAYKDVMFHGRHPVYCLYLSMDPSVVDVNVHPTKHEVRFRDSRTVYDFILKSISQALASVSVAAVVAPKAPIFSPISSERVSPVEQKAMALLMSETTESVKWVESIPAPLKSITQPEEADYPLGHAIAQLKQTYILAQNTQGLVMVDMHAAHERILYEKMKIQWRAESLAVQTLLVPVSVSLTHQEMHGIAEIQSSLSALGLMVEAIAPTAVAIRSCPQLLSHVDLGLLLKELLSDHLEQKTPSAVNDKIETLLGNMACRAAIWANHRLSIPEMNAILRDMEKTPNSQQCNHGRPTFVQLNWKTLDQFFLRGQ